MNQLNNCLILSFMLAAVATHAQFAPQAGNPGTTAIHKDSSIIKSWATGCTLKRGWQDLSDTTLGKVQVGDESYVPGPAANGVVSLGDGGEAIVTFLHPVINGNGYDFAVFENGFTDQTLEPGTAFLELAYVEVSSDGINFVRFDAASHNDTVAQLGPFEGMDAVKINNLAGKYLTNYGTPFDLEELKNAPGLDVNNITHVKIIDVIGSLQNQYAQKDAGGRKINDPWPTPFASSGFDLDAVGVINQDATVSLHEILSAKNISVYPNPAGVNDAVNISLHSDNYKDGALLVSVFDMMGKEVYGYTITQSANQLNVTIAQQGIYQLVIQAGSKSVSKRIVIR